MTVPPYEWPTRMAGLMTRPSARLTAATSPWTVSRQFWVDSTSCPSACSVGISLLKHEPSAHSPWANTMLGLICADMLATPSFGDDQGFATNATYSSAAYLGNQCADGKSFEQAQLRLGSLTNSQKVLICRRERRDATEA